MLRQASPIILPFPSEMSRVAASTRSDSAEISASPRGSQGSKAERHRRDLAEHGRGLDLLKTLRARGFREASRTELLLLDRRELPHRTAPSLAPLPPATENP